jgi:integrase
VEDRFDVIKRGRYWHAVFSVCGQRFRKTTRMTDRALAMKVALEFFRREERRAAGYEDFAETTDLTVEALVEEYHGVLVKSRGRTKAYARLACRRILWLAGGAKTVGKLTPTHIRKALDRVEGPPQTANAYRTAIFGFFRWLVREDRWHRNPVESVERKRVTGKTRNRRALAEEELGALLDAAPPHRAAVYLLAATSGFRRSELDSLTWESFDLDAATVTLKADDAKNRLEAVQPLPAHTVAALRALKADGKLYRRHRSLRTLFPPSPSIETFRRDLEAAGVPYEDESGRVADFHSLRATFATSLARAGVPLAMAQKLMRHSTPALTANLYTLPERSDRAAAVNSLPAPRFCVKSVAETVRKRAFPCANGTLSALSTEGGDSDVTPRNARSQAG